ncbi:AMP-binding protein [Actinoallomurus spadix]|uniref:Cyclohexanecarboxylate-CoA ligase n=1 Tax=Actinoallomurus spadix TaxID=79912 RepID=A0ABN0WWK2_9ACTN|nr:AMP-binding protein [Actinoallomurus spadix]MCO5986668.1 AMP-binding protein [Actinoallomurus spadix]
MTGRLRPAPPPTSRTGTYYARGWWRRETFADDLRAAATATPDRTIFVNWRRDLGREVVVTCGGLAAAVDGLSAGLRGLGLRPGDAVAYQLPNWWEAAALALACLDAGLIAVPVMVTMGAREVERILAGTEAAACVVVDRWEAARPARLLAGLGTRLPCLRHRVVIGDAAATGATAFADLLGASGPRSPAPRGPDEVSLILFTSGTTGEVKGVLHTPNTQYASTRPRHAALRDVPDPRTATPADLTHSVGMRTNVLTPLVTGCGSVFADTRDPDVWLDLLARHRVTHFLGAPHLLRELVGAQRRRRRPLPALRVITSTGAPLPASLVAPIRTWLCPVLVNGFGMTETGGLTATAADDPPGAAGHGIGRPVPGCEVRLVAERPPSRDGAYRLHVRGPSVCAGTFRLRDRRPVWDPAATDGWYDTGDLVGDDGHGGLRYLSRVADRVGSPRPIPVLEVEDELLRHPAVADVAIVGCPDDDGGETVCAVVVPAGAEPTLTDLRRHLLATGMTEWYLPTRLECVDTLPRNGLGKVRKTELRARLRPPAGTGDRPREPQEARPAEGGPGR